MVLRLNERNKSNKLTLILNRVMLNVNGFLNDFAIGFVIDFDFAMLNDFLNGFLSDYDCVAFDVLIWLILQPIVD